MSRIAPIVVTGMFVLAAAVVGFFGMSHLMQASGRTSGNTLGMTPAELTNARASFDANIRRLNAMRAHIVEQFNTKGSYPLSAQMQAVSVGLDPKFADAAAGKFGGSYLYWSETGKDYKLIAIGTGDCFIARADQKALVDPSRAWGPMDCNAYGYWTPNARTR
jgi:hypothetical protein